MSSSLPIRSMTGFARVRRPLGEADIVVNLKSVNHRSLDLHFHTGPEFDPFEAAIRGVLKREVVRGHISIRVTLERHDGGGTLGLDTERLAGYLSAFEQAKQRFGLSGEPDLNAAFRTAGVLIDSAAVDLPADAEPKVLGAIEEAVRLLNESRSREGAQLVTVLRRHNGAIDAAADRIEEIRSRALDAFHTRLRERLAELLGNGAANLDPQRLAQEAAMLADRSDIGEEIARLRIHSGQLAEILDRGGEVGKKLDFLLQEMNRETNTILSKTSGIGEAGLGITEIALAAKSDIEKIREQALNLE